MSEKLISADRLIQFVENWGKHHGREEAADSFLYAIHNAPAVDAVEVVRCRDCSRANQYDDGSDNFVCSLGGTKKGSGYCSDGERRK